MTAQNLLLDKILASNQLEPLLQQQQKQDRELIGPPKLQTHKKKNLISSISALGINMNNVT